MRRAFERRRLGGVRIVPIILESCDWKRTCIGSLKALPKDGKPISNWSNKADAYQNVVTELRTMLDEQGALNRIKQGEATNQSTTIPSDTNNYRIQRDFDAVDRRDFRDNAFEFIWSYIEQAVAEIDAVEGLRGRFYSHSATSFGCTIVNRSLVHGTAHISVHARGDSIGIGDISYSFEENAPSNTANGWFSVESDEYELYLKSSQMGFSLHSERLTPEDAAKQLWASFIKNAGIDQ